MYIVHDPVIKKLTTFDDDLESCGIDQRLPNSTAITARAQKFSTENLHCTHDLYIVHKVCTMYTGSVHCTRLVRF